MAVSHAQTQTSDSHSHPSGFDKVNYENDHNHPQFQDTDPIDEALVPDGLFMEDTQVLDYSDCDEKMRTGVTGFEEEVVLDSEDEEVNGSRIVTLVNMSSDQICAAGLSYVDSQEPGEESQANALGFVDQFVSLNDDLSFDLPGIDIKKTTKVKSLPVTSIKGTQSLAKMVELGSQNEKAKAFEWVDSEEDGAFYFSDKKMESSLVNSEGRERSGIARKEKVRHAYDTKCTRSGDGSKEKSIIQNLHKEITESEGKIENESLNASEDHLDGKPTELQLKPSDEEENVVGMFEVGFDTQIAAEAMEALAYGAHPGHNTVDVDSGGAAKNKAHIDQSLQKSDFSNVEGVSKNVNRRNRSTRTPKRAGVLFQKESKKQELGPALAAVTNLKRTRFFGESCSNSAEANNNLCTESPKSVKTRKLQSAADYSKGSTVKHQIIESISGVMPRKMEDASNNGIVTYRRKKRSLNAQSPEMISSAEAVSNGLVDKKNKVKKDKIVTYRRKKRISGKGSHTAYVSFEGKSSRKSCSLNLGLWGHPKGKRTRRCSKRNLQSSCSFYSISLKNKFDGTLLETQSGKLVGTDPTFSGKEYTAPSNSMSGISMGSSKDVSHRKKPCNKNSPKSYLMKELIGLGVSGSMPDFASKDLRRRKSMAYVQVLFSQHLGDDIIKQQKKIIARLGLSVASCSMDATHFITDQFARTRNMLEFIALGKPVVTHLWLESCGEANCLISEKSYILRDAKKEKKIGFSMLVSLDCANRCPLLKGRKVFITPNIKPGKEMITSLVKTAQGEPVEQAQIRTAKGKKNLDKLLILSCEEDEAICLPFLEKGVAVYNSELLLNGIVIQRLEYKRHQLFTDVVKKVRP
ncbi:LOW QUALITY PROTEIN: uncharacterized protein LOC126783143 [Argentina anserina]|uniref:LOW QUALITY PROTEIN: uncharacterized protein LOC126783143 n=1 Tax=Argentina anserina TaxID=57926 RepID=UPI00217665D6|nr:LOW QUALITY PROTEIN: uncharacterized protein LOC126783143 [Potentilla anserina]